MFQILGLTKMDHEDSNSGFELFSSQPDRKDYEKAPKETIYRFKLLGMEKPRKMSYKLKKGTSLPYTTVIGGDTQNISKSFLNKIVLLILINMSTTYYYMS